MKLAPFSSVIRYRGITVTTLDGVKHTGRQLRLDPDHVRVYEGSTFLDLPSDEVARIEIRHSGRYFHHVVEGAQLSLLPLALCSPELSACGFGVAISIVWTPALLAYTAASTPVFLVADAVAFFIPAKVYEIVH